MRPDDPLDDELARQSSLYGKVVFLIATRGTGAEVLARSLGELPTVAALPSETGLFSQGMGRVLQNWNDDASDQGFHYLCDAQEFLLAARLLADEPLEAARTALGGDVVVEYTADHIQSLDDIAVLYPDATVVHVVRDGRHVAERLITGAQPHAARYAARIWVEDQRAALEADVDGTVKLERVMSDPESALSALAEGLGIEADDGAIAAAATHFKGAQELASDSRTGRAAAIVEIVGPDLLLHFGYALDDTSRSARAAAWSEMMLYGAMAGVLGLRRRAQERLAARFGSDTWRPTPPPK